ncbi:lytic transglycosylase [Craterilacuibacter sinensis]|uniref:LysM peptidoglycan-binding domain-containing protein n=1 Tax=Craterilacuibacter sinensis TaxID=2686017 RepID=A0A845BKC9_9NEIS|nr:LysM peptidoglycan-binding domain-containing protein [Craterilacuibacter sinensis]MXR35734.1 LysM peptidoglycan-binding domain-containing protein [Craterilacuibacter sinensis]
MKKLTLALSLALAFSAFKAPVQAGTLFGKPAGASVDEAMAAGLDMMLLNTSLLRNGDNLLFRAREGFQMAEVNPELIRKIERQYAANPAGLQRSMARSQKYLFFIMNEVEKRGMPTELALLPVVESAFLPTAQSHVGAAGLWQFMPATGRQYGLEQTWWYDGRRDVIDATHAALDYLQYLHGRFGDWGFALAAYNWGEGNVSRAIARVRAQGQVETYENLRLPNETRNYVPKLLAVRNLIAEPEKFGLNLAAFPNKPYFVAVSTGRHMDIDVAARLAEVSSAEFRELNPAFNLPVYAHKSGRQMLLPASKLHRFERNLAAWDKPLLNWDVYMPDSSTDAQSLAQQFNMDANELIRVNNQRNGRFAAGQPVLVAANNSNASPVALRVSSAGRASALETPMVAAIGRDDAAPAQADTTERTVLTPAIQQAAPIVPPPVAPVLVATRITPTSAIAPVVTTTAAVSGLQAASPTAQPIAVTAETAAPSLTIRTTPALQASVAVQALSQAQQAAMPQLQNGQHIVGTGDTLYNISRRYQMSVSELQALNGLDNTTLRLGQSLKISGTPILARPVPASSEAIAQLAQLDQPATFKKVSREYVVQSGDTVFGIARKLGLNHADIQRWNDIGQQASLQPGQRLLIQGL